MKWREVVLSLVLASAAGSLLFFSCGKDSSDDEEVTEQSSEGKDVTQPFVLKIDAGAVDVPAGAFEAGTKLLVKDATVPAEFQTNADVSLASQVIELTATDAGGAPVPEAKQPLTVALELGTTAALAAVEKKNENLCVLNLGVDKVLRIWRFSQLTVSGNQVRFAGIWLGYYAALYCGADTFAEVKVVNATGTGSAVPAGTTSTLPSCDYKNGSADQMGSCRLYAGLAFSIEGKDVEIKSGCDEFKGTIGNGCPSAGVIGVCATNVGEYLKHASYFYTATLPATETPASIEALCLKEFKGTWYAGDKYVPTPTAEQKPQTGDTDTDSGTNTNTNTSPGTSLLAGHGCDLRNATNFGYCRLYVGTAVKTPSADSDNQNACTPFGGAAAWSLEGCPAEGVLGACVDNLGKKNETALVYYTDHLQGGQTADNIDDSCDGQPVQTWVPGTSYTPTPDADQID